MVEGFDFETGKFRGVLGKTLFDLDIRKHITQVLGDSGTGKTLFASLLDLDRRGGEAIGKIRYPNVYVARGTDILSSLSHSLIVIDRGDKILNDAFIEYIRRDFNNVYLIFARGSFSLGLSPNYFGEFVRQGNVVTIKYSFSIGGWF